MLVLHGTSITPDPEKPEDVVPLASLSVIAANMVACVVESEYVASLVISPLKG